MDDVHDRPWLPLEKFVEADDAQQLHDYLESLPPGESARAMSRLDTDDQADIVSMLPPAEAAQLVDQLPSSQAAELVEQLPVDQAAAIVAELESADQADLLELLSDQGAEAILAEMEPDEAQDVRQLRQYAANTAGGLMVTEFLSYSDRLTIGDVVDDLSTNAEEYSRYDVQYGYVVSDDERLVGVLRMRDLLLAPRKTPLSDRMIANPHHVNTGATLDELDQFFQRHHLFGIPVVDDQGRLVGVVRHLHVEEALGSRAQSAFMKFAGIIGGEELRTMPLATRSFRRLSWLVLNILLNVIAASVIAVYQDTLSAAITLAVFLPMISDMSGCSGSQAVAVSMRELVSGLIKPNEYWRVLWKEGTLGMINGLVLGGLLGFLAFAWQGNVYLGLVVGFALAANTVVAVCLGGAIPLIVRTMRLDPALISAPVLTTVTDMCGFMLVLGTATLVLDKLA